MPSSIAFSQETPPFLQQSLGNLLFYDSTSFPTHSDFTQTFLPYSQTNYVATSSQFATAFLESLTLFQLSAKLPSSDYYAKSVSFRFIFEPSPSKAISHELLLPLAAFLAHEIHLIPSSVSMRSSHARQIDLFNVEVIIGLTSWPSLFFNPFPVAFFVKY